MVRKVYETNYASTEEISNILDLLQDADITHYETPKGIFGFSVGAIWVARDEEYSKARRLIKDYDAARAQRVRAEYAKCAATTDWYGGFVTTLYNIWRMIVRRPYEALFYGLIVVILLGIHLFFFRAFSSP